MILCINGLEIFNNGAQMITHSLLCALNTN